VFELIEAISVSNIRLKFTDEEFREFLQLAKR